MLDPLNPAGKVFDQVLRAGQAKKLSWDHCQLPRRGWRVGVAEEQTGEDILDCGHPNDADTQAAGAYFQARLGVYRAGGRTLRHTR